MHRLFILLLLADIGLIVFGRFSAASAWLYYLLVALLPALTFLYYLTAFHITRRQWTRAAGEEEDVQVITSASLIESGAAEGGSWGFLGRAGSRLVFLSRRGGRVTEAASFTLSSVVSVEEERADARTLLCFTLDSGETVRFSLRNRRGSVRSAVLSELGRE